MSAPVRTRPPLLPVLGSNAFVLSVLYLLLGIGVELGRRFYPSRLLQQLSLSLDSLPARALEMAGALGPLRLAHAESLERSDVAAAVSEYESFLVLAGEAPDAARVKKLLPTLKRRLVAVGR